MNNLGTALMNQQLLDKAADPDAYQLRPGAGPGRGEPRHRPGLVQESGGPASPGHSQQRGNPEGSPCLVRAGNHVPHQSAIRRRWKAFEKVAALDPRVMPDTHYFLGSVLLELHEPEKALAEFQTALQINPITSAQLAWLRFSSASAGRSGNRVPPFRNPEPGEDRLSTRPHLRR